MTKDNQRLEHALNNEEVCNHLSLQPSFQDWIATTAFYAALQFVTYKIFPFEISDNKGGKVLVPSLEFYQKRFVSDIKISKHKVLCDLVGKRCPEISPEYDWLLSISYTARYNNYRTSPQIADKAKRLMNEIKKYCNK